MAQISITEAAESLSDTFLLKIVRTTRLTHRFAAEKWVMRDDDPPRFTKRAGARSFARDAAPLGSDLRGKAAIAFRVEAALVQKMIFPNLAAPYHSTFPFLIRQA